MDEEKRNSYIAAGAFFLTGVLTLSIGFDSGWEHGKLVIILGGFLTIIGGAGFKYPQVGEVLLQWVKNYSENQEASSRSNKQTQKNSKNSQQIYAEGDVKITQHIHKSQPKRK
jgi:hypothetical protein